MCTTSSLANDSRRAIAFLGSLVAVLSVTPRADALPRYSARYEQKCALCHVNPSGGGMRSTYAAQDLVPKEIAWSKMKPEAIAEIETHLAKQILIGADLREVYLGANVEPAHQNFFQMQSSLYIAIQPDPRFTLYFDRGQSNSYQSFALGYLLPTLYLKAGRFVPSYGWKFDDHTMFVREELGLMPPANSDVGLEAGYSIGSIDIQAAVVNGNPGDNPDNNTKVAGVVNAVGRHRVGPIGGALGAAGYHRPSPARDYDTAGLYGYLTFRRFTWVGEADLIRRQESGGPVVQGVASSHEFSYLLHRGLELKATYDFYDPDRDLASGSKSRWGGGAYFMPFAYLTFEALVRRIQYSDGLAYAGQDYTETFLQLHALY
jgi:hypothetical protein